MVDIFLMGIVGCVIGYIIGCATGAIIAYKTLKE